MKGPRLYWLLKPAKPRQAAISGCRAYMQEKTVSYYSLTAKSLNIATRLAPRCITTKTAGMINDAAQKRRNR